MLIIRILISFLGATKETGNKVLLYSEMTDQVDTPDDSWFTQLWLWDATILGTETFPGMQSGYD